VIKIKNSHIINNHIVNSEKETQNRNDLQEEILRINVEKHKLQIQVDDLEKNLEKKSNQVGNLDETVKVCLSQNKANQKFLSASILMQNCRSYKHSVKHMAH